MLVKSHHSGSKKAKALFQGGHVSVPYLVTSKMYDLKRILAPMSWRCSDVNVREDNAAALTVMLRSQPRV
jgi:hypothetical protein